MESNPTTPEPTTVLRDGASEAFSEPVRPLVPSRGIFFEMENQEITKEQLEKIRALDDFDLTMLLSEIHDHGWEKAAVLLTLMPVTDE